VDSLFEDIDVQSNSVEAEVAKRIFAADLNTGDSVDAVFVITRISLKEYDRGKFLTLRLADRTGKISAVLWENAEATFRQIRDGDVVQVRGKVNTYQDELQVSIRTIERVMDLSQLDPSDFLPSSPVPLQEMIEEFDQHLEEIQDVHLQQVLFHFRRDEKLWNAFIHAPGAKLWHHPYLHGLLEHTLNVVRLCRCISPMYSGVDCDLLTTGAVFHDLGKTVEFDYQYKIDYSTDGRLLGHVYISAAIAEQIISEIKDFPAEKRRQLLHIILSHHGETERSPVLPMTLEAALLHHIENMDAQMMAFIREMNKARGENQDWTSYVNLIQRYLYLGDSRENCKESSEFE
jgi:3'-5' exoribonuclease